MSNLYKSNDTNYISVYNPRIFFNILHTMYCFVTYSKSCKHRSLSLSPISTFASLFIPLFSHFHSFSLPHSTQCPSLFLFEILHQEGGPRGPRESQHTNLSSAHKPHGTEGSPGSQKKNAQALQHRGQAWGAETSAHKPATQRAGPGSQDKCTQALLHRGQTW